MVVVVSTFSSIVCASSYNDTLEIVETKSDFPHSRPDFTRETES